MIKCKKCLEEKAKEYFTVDKRRPDGIIYTCKSCYKKQVAIKSIENRERINKRSNEKYHNLSLEQKALKREKARIYVASRRDLVNDNAVKYYKANSAKIRLMSKANRLKNRDKRLERDRERYAENKDSINEKIRERRRTRKENGYSIIIKCKNTDSVDGVGCYCKDCKKKQYKNMSPESKAELIAKVKNYYIKNRAEIRRKANETRTSNPVAMAKALDRAKDYYNNNKSRCRLKRNIYEKKRRREDPVFKFRLNMTRLTCQAFKSKGYSKNTKTYELLGIDLPTLILYIERQFTKGMNWSNQGNGKGKWQIDHKIPLAYAKSKEEVIKLCHYTNLRPLWAMENLLKSNKILPFQLNIGL